jgi:uncharacterized protein YlzI (FlbEa/FlbD family)
MQDEPTSPFISLTRIFGTYKDKQTRQTGIIADETILKAGAIEQVTSMQPDSSYPIPTTSIKFTSGETYFVRETREEVKQRIDAALSDGQRSTLIDLSRVFGTYGKKRQRGIIVGETSIKASAVEEITSLQEDPSLPTAVTSIRLTSGERLLVQQPRDEVRQKLAAAKLTP